MAPARYRMTDSPIEIGLNPVAPTRGVNRARCIMATQDPAPTFAPLRYKATTRDQWERAAEAWDRWGPTIQAWLGPATETMLDMAGVGPGARIVDIAAGAGEPAITAARRVGAIGSVVATDISPAILAYARRAAEAQGVSNLETKVMDGGTWSSRTPRSTSPSPG